MDPARFANAHHANLDVEAPRLPGEMRCRRLGPLRPVVRMERKACEEIRAAGEARTGRKTVDLQETRRGVKRVARHIPIPEPHFARRHCQRVTLFRSAEQRRALRNERPEPCAHFAQRSERTAPGEQRTVQRGWPLEKDADRGLHIAPRDEAQAWNVSIAMNGRL